MANGVLETRRLRLVPITVGMVEAMLAGNRAYAEEIASARLPEAWPGRALVERAFCAHLEAIRDRPEHRLWGDRVCITREAPHRVVGSVVFHGGPDHAGSVEIAYGIEEESRGRGFGFEAVSAMVTWALTEEGVQSVRAATFTWHLASRRILERLGFQAGGSREELLGEMLEYERRR